MPNETQLDAMQQRLSLPIPLRLCLVDGAVPAIFEINKWTPPSLGDHYFIPETTSTSTLDSQTTSQEPLHHAD